MRLGRGAAPTNKRTPRPIRRHRLSLGPCLALVVCCWPRSSQHRSSTWDSAWLRRALLRACSAPWMELELVPMSIFVARASPQLGGCAMPRHIVRIIDGHQHNSTRTTAHAPRNLLALPIGVCALSSSRPTSEWRPRVSKRALRPGPCYVVDFSRRAKPHSQRLRLLSHHQARGGRKKARAPA